MSDIEKEDSLTRLNTQLNKSMVLMDSASESVEPLNKSNKSIKINTKVQPANNSKGLSSGSRKSILKKTNKTDFGTDSELKNEKIHDSDEKNVESNGLSETITKLPRPQTLKDLVQEECLLKDTTGSTFTLEDISDNEDVWIMDIPRTIDPNDLRRQTITFGEKSKFKIGEEKYSAVNHESKCRITCVFNTGHVTSQYRTVNIRPAGTIAVRKKLSNIRKVEAVHVEDIGVPFPENVKTRHPLFGVTHDGKVVKEKKKRRSIGAMKT